MPLPRGAVGRAYGARGREARASGSSPALLSVAASQISGSPISAVGSRDSMLLEQHDAEPLSLEASDAIVRLLDLEIARERVALAAGEADLGAIDVRTRSVPTAVSSTVHAGVEHDRLALRRLELRERDLVAPGLAQQPPVERSGLIGADHDRVVRGDARGLRGREPLGHAFGRLARKRAFVGRRRANLERQTEPAEQLAPIPRGRREKQRSWRARSCVTHGFDSRNSVTYDARPMSGSLRAWYSLRDLTALGGRQGELDGELELADLPRLAGLLHSTAGSVRASLHFRQRGRRRGRGDARSRRDGRALCQRCLEPFAQPIEERVELMLVEPGASSAVDSGGLRAGRAGRRPLAAGSTDRGRIDRVDSARAEACAHRGLW